MEQRSSRGEEYQHSLPVWGTHPARQGVGGYGESGVGGVWRVGRVQRPNQGVPNEGAANKEGMDKVGMILARVCRMHPEYRGS